MRRLIPIALVIGIAVYAALVAQRNPAPLSLDLVFYRVPEVQLWLLLFGAALAGAAAALVIVSWPYLRLRLLVRRQSRRITHLEQEVHGLRTLPFSDESEDRTRPASSRRA